MKLPFDFEVGDVVIPMPIGIDATLQYGPDGTLEKIYKGFDGAKDITNSVMDFARTHNWLPLSISVTGGTSWVRGLFYTGIKFIPEKLGNISTEFDDSLTRLLSDYPQQFNFFAVDFKSTAFAIKGYRNINSWLNSGLFKTLKSIVILTGTHNTFSQDVMDIFPFPFPEISGYYIYHGVDTSYIPTNIVKRRLISLQSCLDPYGYVFYRCIFDDNSTQALSYDVVADSCIEDDDIIYQHNHQLLSVSHPHSSHISHDYTHYSCPVCGRVTKYEGQSAMICSNLDCTSRIFFDINTLLEALKLPSLDYNQYTEEVDRGSISKLEDVLSIVPYRNMPISSSISDLIDGLIPFEQLRNRSLLHEFVSKCCNNLLTVRSYLTTDASTISTDLRIDIKNACKLKAAFTDRMVRLFNKIIELPNFELVDGITYQNAPIFRNKTIAITGDFVHGVTSQIIAILNSYGASVKTHFDDSCDCLIVGDKNENVSGLDVRRATKKRKDVFTEGYFFAYYEIDADMQSQLI